MNFATRALLPLLSISVNDAEPSGGSGGGGGGEDGGGSSGDGKGSGSNEGEGQGEGEEKPDAAAAKGGKAADEDKAFTTKLEAKLKTERAANAKSYESWKPKLPEGMPFDEKSFGDFRKEFAEAGLKPEQAQKFVDLFAKAELGRLQSVANELKDERARWDKTVRADKELAGADGSQLDETAAAGRKAMQKFATPGFRELLKKSGLESHPEMLRFAARVGKGLAEDKTDGAREGGGKKELTPEQKLRARYPNSPELFQKS